MAAIIYISPHTLFLQCIFDTPPSGGSVGVLSPRTWADFFKCLNQQNTVEEAVASKART